MKKNLLVKAGIITLGAIVVLAVAGTVFFAKMVSDQVFYQNANNPTHENSIKQLKTWGYDLDGFNATYTGEEISVTAEDGNVVPGSYFDMGSDTCVVLVHGAGGDRVSTYPLAQLYLEKGYDVIAFDERGHGENPDEKVTFGIQESLDVKALVRYAREERNNAQVIVHGQSMGGQTTAVYASNVKQGEADAADAVICDSPVPGMEYMIQSVIAEEPEEMDSFVPAYLTGASKLYSKIFYGIDYEDGDTIEVVAQDELPTMVIVSTKDQVCLPEKVEEVYANVGSEQKSIVYVDSAHIEGVIDDPAGYMENVEAFLATCGIS